LKRLPFRGPATRRHALRQNRDKLRR